MQRSQFLRSALALALAGVSLAAQAQPDQPIKLLVGFPPGGSTDTIARLLADKMATVLKQPVVVENKPGAGGRLAAQALKAAPADGLTYMIAPNATPVFQTLLYPPAVLKYDMLTDFTPVGMIASYPLALVVNTQSGIKTAKDYVAWVKGNPRNASFGTAILSSGIGRPPSTMWNTPAVVRRSLAGLCSTPLASR